LSVTLGFAVAYRLKQLAGIRAGLGFLGFAFAVPRLLLLLGLGITLLLIPLLGFFAGRLKGGQCLLDVVYRDILEFANFPAFKPC
jgi:hypothetical protein